MNLIIKDRAKGKTSDLIRMSARTGIPIVCLSPKMISLMAKEMGLDIPEPVSFGSVITNPVLKFEYEKIYIDDLDYFFKYVMGVDVECATIDFGGGIGK